MRHASLPERLMRLLNAMGPAAASSEQRQGAPVVRLAAFEPIAPSTDHGRA